MTGRRPPRRLSRTSKDVRAQLAAWTSEAEFQSQVIVEARKYRWRAFHHPDSRFDSEPGLPDLLLLHKPTGRIVLVELKKMDGTLRDSQYDFLEEAALDPKNELAIWRPDDWDEIARVLTGHPCRPVVIPPRPVPRTKETAGTGPKPTKTQPTGAEALALYLADAHSRRPRR